MKLRRYVSTLLISLIVCGTGWSQDLGDELNAIDDFPEADTPSAQASPDASKGGGEELPDDDLGDLGADTAAPKENPEDMNLDDLGPDENVSPTQDGELPEDDLGAGDDQSTQGLEQDLSALDEKTPPNADEATTGLDLGAPAKISSLNFRQLSDRVRAVVHANKAIDFSRQIRAQRKQIIVEIRNSVLTKSVLKRALDTGEFDGPVALVQAYDSKAGSISTVKILFQLRQMQEFKITRSGNDLYIDFGLGGDGRLFRSGSAAKTPTLPETFLTLDSKTRFTGKKISLNVKDAELSGVLKKLQAETGQNFILTGATAGKVSLNLSNTPWDQILAIILANLKLGYQKMGNVYRIAPVADLRTEISDAAKIIADSENLIPLETRLIPVNYARASEVSANIKDFQSARGKLSIDARTNSLVATDTPDVLDKIVTYIRSIDKQTALVQIEARIVEATEAFNRNLSQRFGIGPIGSGSLAGSFVSVGSGSAPAVGSKGLNVQTNLGSIGAIDAFLDMTESETQSKTIASPRVTVLDNKAATIENGVIRNLIVTNQVTGVSAPMTVNQTLKLRVTPQVTSDGFVMLDISLNRDTPIGDQDTTTRSANTFMLVESGKTAVIGGIYTIDRNSTEAGWPLLRALPILGNLFRVKKNVDNSTTELLMFISPKIVNTNRAFLSYKEDLKDGEVAAPKQSKADEMDGAAAFEDL